jgi:hypothetical protein
LLFVAICAILILYMVLSDEVKSQQTQKPRKERGISAHVRVFSEMPTRFALSESIITKLEQQILSLVEFGYVESVNANKAIDSLKQLVITLSEVSPSFTPKFFWNSDPDIRSMSNAKDFYSKIKRKSYDGEEARSYEYVFDLLDPASEVPESGLETSSELLNDLNLQGENIPNNDIRTRAILKIRLTEKKNKKRGLRTGAIGLYFYPPSRTTLPRVTN